MRYNGKGDKMKKILVSLLIIVFLFSGLFIYNNYKEDERKNKLEIIENIKGHYNNYVKTNNNSKIYDFVDGNYIEIGMINNNTELSLSQIIIDENTKYFHIENLDYYIGYENVSPIEKLKDNSDHYKNYIVFNENIVTKETTNFYDENGLIYTINKSFNLPIIIKEDDAYYVEYDNKLLFVKKEDVEKIVENSNSNDKTRDNIRTLAYHFVYKEGEKCTNSYICHPEQQFVSHMKYLHDNSYFTLTMNDLKLFLEGKIQIPEKSIVITLDDGYLASNAIKIMDQYEIHGTYFVVASWVNPEELKSDYVELASHTNNMHNTNHCAGSPQGSQLLCESQEKIVGDLKASRDRLNNTTSFAYPFYEYNTRLIEILKETGFEMAFIGADTTLGASNLKTDLFKIPRLTLSSLTTMEEFIEYLK